MVEGETDRVLLEHVLHAWVPSQTFDLVAAGGRSSAISLARTLLATTDRRVAAVVDSDTTDADRVSGQRGDLEASLASVGAVDRFRIILARPELEVVWFETPEASALLGTHLPEEWRVRAQFEPKLALEQILHSSAENQAAKELVRFLKGTNLKPLGQGPTLGPLVKFIGSFGNDFGAPREMHKTKCTICGEETSVPFAPSKGKPVYCRVCYAARKPRRF